MMLEIIIATSEILKINQALNFDEQALAALRKAGYIQANMAIQVEDHKRQAEESLNKLVNRKKAILSIHMSRFIQVYQKIQSIDFRPGEGILEISSRQLTPACMDSINAMTATALLPLSEKELVTTYLLKGIGGAVREASQRNLEIAKSQLSLANVEKTHAKNYITAIDAIRDRANQISLLLAKIGALFNQSIQFTSKVIEKNGTDRTVYSDEDIGVLMTCVNLACAAKDILDAPILGRDGSVTEEALKAIETGQNSLDMLRDRIKGR